MIDSTDPVTVGMDLGDRKTFVVELGSDRKEVERGKVNTTKAGLRACLGDRDPMRVVLEAGTHSRWIDSLLKELGHEVLVVDPRRLPRNHLEDKNDWKDAEHLARVGQAMPELFHEVHHRDDAVHADLSILHARDLLVATRTKLVNFVRTKVKSVGERLPKCGARSFHKTVAEALPERLKRSCTPILSMLEALEVEIRSFDKAIDELAEERYPEAATMTQVTGVGNCTALALMLSIGDKHRFTKSRNVGSYFGLRPRLAESCSIDHQLRINKAGNPFVRRLLVTAAHYILGPLCRKDSALRRWGNAYCERGGKNAKKRAVIAIARKLAVLLHRLWMTGEVYDPLRGCRSQDIASLPAVPA